MAEIDHDPPTRSPRDPCAEQRQELAHEAGEAGQSERGERGEGQQHPRAPASARRGRRVSAIMPRVRPLVDHADEQEEHAGDRGRG